LIFSKGKTMTVLFQTRQWDVTSHGLEAREFVYPIEKDRLINPDDHEKGYSWVRHIGETKDVSFDLDDFMNAYLAALTIHRVALAASDVELILTHYAKIKRKRARAQDLKPFMERARAEILGETRDSHVIMMDEIERTDEIEALAEKLMREA
jgi:hypothetical protein